MCNPNHVAAIADSIAAHVRDRERELIRKLRDAVRAVQATRNMVEAFAAWENADAVLAEADAWLAEPVRIEVDAAHGEAR